VDTAFVLVALVASVTAVAALAAKLRVSPPLLLVVVGFAMSYIPLMNGFEISSELVLVGLLPPLLYSSALRTSLVDFRRNLRPILLLSVGLVAFTVVGVGLVAMWVLPIPPAIAFALGAIVAPPDAVAASAVARRVGIPRRLVTILEGESLVNDATALVALRTAVGAVAVAVSTWDVVLDFVWASAGGALVGVAIAYLTGYLRKKITDVLIDTSISLVTPFVAYLLAEELHASGVLAVVIAGLLLGHKAFLIQSASGRIVEQNNWRTIAFVLENAVFAMIGLQARTIVAAVGDTDLPISTIVWACVAVLAAVIVLRLVWMFPATYISRLVPRVAERDPAPNWRVPLVLGWTGMRGVVTLAAAFSLAADVEYREVLVLVALVVVAGTLLLQGSTLPWLVRRLDVAGPDSASDALAEASVYQSAVGAGLSRLEEITDGAPDGTFRPEVLERLKTRSLERTDAVWERLGGSSDTPSQVYARVRIEMLTAEREAVLKVRDSGVVDAPVLTRVLAALDVEEAMLDRSEPVDTSTREEDLEAHGIGTAGAGGCDHLRDAPRHRKPTTPSGCEECLRDGTEWVHLRLCLTCGHVGCCDSSVHKHATGHFHETDHPVMRSFEIGEAWRWCFVDDLLG
jgi:Na+/H+ antiporter